MTRVAYHIDQFSEKVRAMNQTHKQSITLSAADARDLHHEIFELLVKITELNNQKSTVVPENAVTVDLDGGSFSKHS